MEHINLEFWEKDVLMNFETVASTTHMQTPPEGKLGDLSHALSTLEMHGYDLEDIAEGWVLLGITQL